MGLYKLVLVMAVGMGLASAQPPRSPIDDFSEAIEKLIREVILQVKRGRLQRAYFREKFAIDILTRFAPALDRLCRAGYVTIDAQGVLVARSGLLRVDELLQEFFLPQHQHARYT